MVTTPIQSFFFNIFEIDTAKIEFWFLNFVWVLQL